MPQYHYVVGYNSDINKWFLEWDSSAYFPDGHVYDDARSVDGYGWFFPDDDTPAEAALDEKLSRTLQYIIDTFPLPQEA